MAYPPRSRGSWLKALTPIGAGLMLGVGGALLAARLLESLLYEVEPNDPLVLGSIALLLGGSAVVEGLHAGTPGGTGRSARRPAGGVSGGGPSAQEVRATATAAGRSTSSPMR